MNITIGSKIANRYLVEAGPFRGAQAEVYKVYDEKRATTLALKVMREDLAEDKVFLRRFQREAQTLERLEHPNIVRFYGLEKEGILAYILMDYIEGESLRTRIHISKKPLDFGETLKIIQQVCSALHYSHGMGVVHCDLKPGNILLDTNGKAFVTDFGIARMSESATATLAGAGTPAYMSPEQIRGAEPSPSMDIYALGVVLYEMLTGGERPFTGENAHTTGSTTEKVRWEQLNKLPPSPRKFNKRITPEMEAMILKCLAKKPGKRFGSVMEIQQALEKAIPEVKKIRDVKKTKPNVSVSKSGKKEKISPSVHVEAPIKPKQINVRKNQGLVLGILIVLGLFLIIAIFLSVFANKNKLLSFSTSTIVTTNKTTPKPTQTPTLIAGQISYSSKDYMPVIYIPAGNFTMGSLGNLEDPNRYPETPPHSVYLQSYYIDQHEVTNAQYARCVQVGVCTSPNKNSSNTRNSYYNNSQYNDYPVIFVNWNQANTYCQWAGRRLPTEAEWEKAARGTDERVYPWGNIDPKTYLANFSNSIADTSKVCSYSKGNSPYGICDMAGNVWEWVSDWYGSIYYQSSTINNPTGPDQGLYKVFRGGSWDSDSQNIL